MIDLLGQRIREARLAQGLSLRETAGKAGVSASLLSQVETGKVQPSVATLYAIVTCLDLSIDELLDHHPAAEPERRPRPGDPVQRASQAPVVRMENGVTWHGLAVMGAHDHVDGVLATYAPRASSSLDDAHMRHAGVEYGYLLSGELTLKLDFESYVLRAGDSFCFDSMRPHVYVNHTDAEAQGIWYVVGRSDKKDEGEAGPPRTGVDVLDELSRLPGPRGSH